MMPMVERDRGSLALFQGKIPLTRWTVVFLTGISSAFKKSELNNLGVGDITSVRAVSLVLVDEQPSKVIVIKTKTSRIILSLNNLRLITIPFLNTRALIPEVWDVWLKPYKFLIGCNCLKRKPY
jgi:hypothetical protein